MIRIMQRLRFAAAFRLPLVLLGCASMLSSKETALSIACGVRFIQDHKVFTVINRLPFGLRLIIFAN